jgi:hypothetical protein
MFDPNLVPNVRFFRMEGVCVYVLRSYLKKKVSQILFALKTKESRFRFKVSKTFFGRT